MKNKKLRQEKGFWIATVGDKSKKFKDIMDAIAFLLD